MIRITPDVGRNILVVEIFGKPDSSHLAEVESVLLSAVLRLRVPFDVLSDVRHLESLEGIPFGEALRLGRLLVPKQVRRVVRVVGRSSSAAIQAERLSRELGFSAHLAFTREEAEALLAQR